MTPRAASAGGIFAAGLAASVAALLLFAWLAERVARGAAIAFDGAVRAGVHRHASPGLTELMRLVSELGSVVPLFLICALTFAALLAAHSQRAALFLVLTMIGAVLLDATLKLTFHRPRPVPFFGTPAPLSYSFPSGHALILACYFGIVAAFLTARLRRRSARILVWLAAAVLAGMVGYSRIYLGVHYPSDVIGGYAAAIIWVTAAAHADRSWKRRSGVAAVLVLLLCSGQPAMASSRVDRVEVFKQRHELLLLKDGKIVKTYKVALGSNPVGRKERQGDEKTPEGSYVLDRRNAHSKFHRSIHISYPSAEDVKRARGLGVPPGGDIFLHGLPNGAGFIGAAHRQMDWTTGCIAVTDEEIDEIWNLVSDGTLIVIHP
ncbi:MAG TPA: phosphatase PAP2 family protein [Bryobacteraceae bacterium]|nr:phosphatase PAP2 family protein [Bryobacteraceae bacterium]